MNKRRIILFLCVVLAPLLIVLHSCSHDDHGHHSIMEKIEAESEDYQGVKVSSNKYVEDLEKIHVILGTDTFFIPERKSQIRSFECSECHDKPLATMQANRDTNTRKAHWDIKLEHAGISTMNCATCHDGDHMNELKSLTGSAIDLNLSFKVCGQCHSEQYKDWKGGAHGKRIGGWAPPRVSKTCVNCHNPHSPAIPSKWPSRFNTQKVLERE